MTDDIHSCSLFCDLPACIKRQRDEYRQGLIDALPVQPAAPVALTDAHLCVILLGIEPTTKRLPPGFKEFARAIEAAHGIGTTPQPAEGEI